jgi:hypothetical protein
MSLLDNAPASFDIQTIVNADLSFTLTMKDGAGADIDFTGYRIVMQVRDDANIVAVELNTTNDRISIDTTVATFNLPAAFNPLPQIYRYDILFTSPSNVQLDPLSGKFIVLASVTP